MKKLAPCVVFFSFFLWWNSFALKSELEALQKLSSSVSVLPKAFFKVVALGFSDFAEEILFFNLLADLGEKKISIEKKQKLTEKITVFSSLSPRIEVFYTLSCFVLLFDFDDEDRCLKILENGKKTLSTSWRIPLSEGYVYAFHLGRQEEAAKAYREASQKTGAPSYLFSLSEKLRLGKVTFLEEQKTKELLFEEKGS